MSQELEFIQGFPQRRAELTARFAKADTLERLELKVRCSEKLLEHLNAQRTERSLSARHLDFLIHLREQQLKAQLEELKTLKNDHDLRYLGLEAFVSRYVEDNELQENLLDLSPEDLARKEELEAEQQTWEKLIQSVRERMKKNPQNLQLTRLLAEHQARLLSTQEALSALDGRAEEEETVFEKAERELAAHESPELQKLRRELALMQGLYEKTQKRLAQKPELIHLKALMQQQWRRVEQLAALIQEAVAAEKAESAD